MSYVNILQGDCRALLANLKDNSIDSIVTDPPYELGFMGKRWDSSGIAYDLSVWRECLRVLKPGGHLLSFGGTRTYHRMTCAIEDAGFEIRDCIMWVYGSGFPKSHDVSKAIDKAAGAEREVVGPAAVGGKGQGNAYGTITRPLATAPATEAARQWQGWGSALKPSCEPVVVARKPLIGTIAENVLAYGTGALNIDGCRIEHTTVVGANISVNTHLRQSVRAGKRVNITSFALPEREIPVSPLGRWPANLIHDGSQEVIELFPETGPSKAIKGGANRRAYEQNEITNPSGWKEVGRIRKDEGYDDNGGSAARFFYCAKTSPSERGDNRHPTVKPISLMRYLCRLVTPPSGVVLDPFAGSGTTLVAARLEGFSAVGCELQQEHVDIIKRRLDLPAEAYAEEPREEENPKPPKREQLKLF
jgi:site-specific DNA-methyltransferase (adenine-specific)